LPSGVDLPQGWSYDDPWSYLLATETGDGRGGKLDEEFIKAFKSSTFELGSIPSIPPPISLRG
jgi:nucleoporin NUP42